jgi:hypothetical protein
LPSNPFKSGGTYVATTHCIDQGHIGWCPSCFGICGVKEGCGPCKIKGDAILDENPNPSPPPPPTKKSKTPWKIKKPAKKKKPFFN